MGKTCCKMNYLLLSCGITCCLTKGILCKLLLYNNIYCFHVLLQLSYVILCYLMLAHIIIRYTIRNQMGPNRPNGTKLDQTGPNKNIRDHTDHKGPHMTIQDYTWLSGTIQDHMGPNWAIWDHTRPYGTIA